MSPSYVQVISSEPLKPLRHTKFGIVVHHNEPECHAKDWFDISKVNVTTRVYAMKRMTSFTILIFFIDFLFVLEAMCLAGRLSSMVHHHKPVWLLK